MKIVIKLCLVLIGLFQIGCFYPDGNTTKIIEQAIFNSFKNKNYTEYLELNPSTELLSEYLISNRLNKNTKSLQEEHREEIDKFLKEENINRINLFKEIIKQGEAFGIVWSEIVFLRSENREQKNEHITLDGTIYFKHKEIEYALKYRDCISIKGFWYLPKVYFIEKTFDKKTNSICLKLKDKYIGECIKAQLIFPVDSNDARKVCECSFEKIINDPNSDCKSLIENRIIIDGGCSDLMFKKK